jgi:hypothetical protein
VENKVIPIRNSQILISDLYIVNDRNQIEFERQGMPSYPPMPPPIPASIYPPVNTMHSSVQSYQEQVQEAKRISENLQANVRVYLDPNNKKRKTGNVSVGITVN